MKDGSSAEEPAEVSRRELYGDYVNYFLQPGAEVRPCCDPSVLKKTARYLRSEPEPAEAFTVFPFYRAVRRDCASPGAHGRKHLTAFIRATELLETICVNLFLQPWKKEIKTLKTFTGPFVYGLLPVLSSSTIQSVLGSIGYLPHTDPPHSEYRLRDDVNPDSAMLLGFELLLARVTCDHLLEILEKDQLDLPEFLEVLQRRMDPAQLDEPPGKITMGQKEEENKKMEEAHRKEVPPILDPMLAVNPQPKPRRCRNTGVDQSIMEMQMTYPDLAFRGRPLRPGKPQRANGSSKDVHAPNTKDNSGDGKAAEVPKVGATTIRSRNDGSKADDVVGDDCRGSGCSDRNRGGGPAAGDANSGHIGTTDGGAGDGGLRGPQALSLHITLRAASIAEQSLKPGEAPPTAAPPAHTQQPTVADLQTNRAPNPTHPSLSSMDEAQELRELAERMGQLRVQDANEEVKSKEGNKREEATTNQGSSETEGQAEEETLGEPALSHAAARGSRSSQSDPAVMEEQRRHHSTPAGFLSCKGGDGTEPLGVEGPVRAEPGKDEEQLTKSFVMVERHDK
ncbi:Spermatogenesis-associated protein 2 [Liparis tanakae]|uniref:Spermatogenesis-associated protein 2 n=1 Tax=Liparis tanakae TaxID=230148 RepID=A0A4Z2HDJ8_9TELE|nr:Spermatogenesis-associated protein 2 [Liparis tanakae]